MFYGNIGVLVHVNDCCDFADPSERYKWVDDLSLLEIVNLVTIGLSSYNFHNHVASDVGIDQYYIDPANLKSQTSLNKIASWTEMKKMKLNEDKTKIMIFNETTKNDFTTRLIINDHILEIITETELLGVVISSDLSWKKNTKQLVQRAYRRTILLHKLFDFAVPEEAFFSTW